MTVQFTASMIEQLLTIDEYKPIARMDKRTLTPEQKQEVNALEDIVSFGQDAISLFDNLLHQKQTLPTQKEYVGEGIHIMIEWILENRPEITISETLIEACKLRLTRTYMSKVIELHLDCILQEQSELKITTFPLLDSVMGVDIIAEDDKKRYYIHVTSNTPFAQRMLEQKENRGGYRVGKAYIPYSRDFSGDIIFKYDVHAESDSTQVINGFPLFKPEYVHWKLTLAKRSLTFGEDINKPYSKLQHFKDWARTYLNMNITSI